MLHRVRSKILAALATSINLLGPYFIALDVTAKVHFVLSGWHVFVFAMWPFFGFSYPRDPMPPALNVLA